MLPSFRPSSRPGLLTAASGHRLLVGVLVLLLVVLSVKISWLLLSRLQPASSGLSAEALIASKVVTVQPQFSGLQLFAAPVKPVLKPIVGIPETRLPLKVQGLYLGSLPETNQVVMAVQGKPGVYLAGDRLPLSGQVLVLAVEPAQILLRHNGRKEKLTLRGQPLLKQSLAQQNAAITSRPQALAVQSGESDQALYLAESSFAQAVPDYRQRILKDPLFLSRYLSLSPHNQNGQLQGYQLRPGRDAALYQALKLKSGDVLVSLNQQPVSDTGKVLALLPQLGQASQLTLGLLRSGQPVTYTLYL